MTLPIRPEHAALLAALRDAAPELRCAVTAAPLIDPDFDNQSPFFVGAEVARIAGPHHHSVIYDFLDVLLEEDSPWPAVMARQLPRFRGDPERGARALLQAFERGLNVGAP